MTQIYLRRFISELTLDKRECIVKYSLTLSIQKVIINVVRIISILSAIASLAAVVVIVVAVVVV